MLEQERRGSLALVRFAHGPVHALDVELANAIAETLTTIDGDASVDAIVLTGTGAAFSAGVDLKRLVDEDPDYADRLLVALDAAFLAVWNGAKPIVAAINGHAIAGGLVLAFACDYRLMAAGNGRLGVPELAAGVPFPWLALELVRTSVAAAQLPELTALGETFGADDGKARGIVQEVVPADELIDRAAAIAHRLAANAGPGFVLQRRQLRQPSIDDPRRAPHDREVRAAWRAEATRERVRAYMASLRKR